MSRRVVISADDFGRDAATSEVILALLDEGLVTATTLIVVASHAARAAEAVRERGIVPRLHATLTSEAGLPPWRALSGAASLGGAGGALLPDPFALARRAGWRAVAAELDAQLEWMRAAGLDPAAADSHAGTLYGLHGEPWLRAAIAWCARHGLAFRLPRDASLYLGGPLAPDLASAHAAAVAEADRLGVRLPDAIATNRRTAAELGSYEALRAHYLALLPRLPEGTSEVFLHPSRDGAVPGNDGVLRVWEARLLRDPAWHAALASEGFELVPGW